MAGLNGTFGRKPRKFDYKPRFYDRQAEQRALRRDELKSSRHRIEAGQDYDNKESVQRTGAEHRYIPGKYVREQTIQERTKAVERRRAYRNRKARYRILILALLTAIVVWVIWTN